MTVTIRPMLVVGLSGALIFPTAARASADVAEKNRTLSNERTSTVWAHPAWPSPIYARPDIHARRIGRLHFYTEDQFPEVYLLLSKHLDRSSREWIRLRMLGRPNGRVGWAPRSAF